LAKFLKLLFRTGFAKFLKLFVQDWFGKVLQALCSGLIWQSSSSFMFTTDLANGSIIPTAWEKKFKHHHPLLQKTLQLVPPLQNIFRTLKSWRRFSACEFFCFVQNPFSINVHFDRIGFFVVLGIIPL
jgi:hypothetical protein